MYKHSRTPWVVAAVLVVLAALPSCSAVDGEEGGDCRTDAVRLSAAEKPGPRPPAPRPPARLSKAPAAPAPAPSRTATPHHHGHGIDLDVDLGPC
ncbi:hypothetical protein OG234_13555 [Streptomyces sp. NBC_01420]|uniref:hypothetical protein n=1 Tax=Streptomyces sp. NBC_01420 TaxID=2903858 RepID=UPI003255A325